MRGVVLALREFTAQNEVSDHTRDMAAFIVLALNVVSETIEQSVSAWEKRGYWLKADRFRLQWAWTESCSQRMHKALLDDDWAEIAMTAARIAEKSANVKLPKRHKLGTPWVGSWKELQDTVISDLKK